MKTLLILRHAKSSWSDNRLADINRPLNTRGKTDAPRMGQLLQDEDLVPELVISSPAKRATQTAELVVDHCSFDGDLNIASDFYHGGVDEYIEGLRGIPGDEKLVMIVGHNPGMEELLDYLTGEPETLTTANIAVVELPIEQWGQLDYETEGNLITVYRPKELS